MPDPLPQWFNDLANLSSVAELLVTIFLFIEARGITNSFLIKATLPDSIKKLENFSSKISSDLGDWSNKERLVQKHFSEALGCLKTLEKKLPSTQKKEVSDLIKKLRFKKFYLWDKKLTENDSWKLYADLSKVIVMLDQLQKDSKWKN